MRIESGKLRRRSQILNIYFFTICVYIDAIMFLSSKDRLANEDARKCTYQYFNQDGVYAVGMSEYEVVSQFDNINESNYTAVIDDGTTSYPITLTTGFYDGAALAVAVQAAINAAIGGGCVVSFNANEKFDLTTVTPFRFIQPNPVTPQTYTDWSVMMGFSEFTETSLYTTMAGKMANLVYTNFIYFTSRNLNIRQRFNDFSSNNQLSGILGVAMLYNDNANTPAVYKNQDEIRNIKWITYNAIDAITTIDVSVFDERGNAIPDSQKNNFSYIITVSMKHIEMPGQND